MSHLSYNEFKNRFGDLGITIWTKMMYLNNGFKDGNNPGFKKIKIDNETWLYQESNNMIYCTIPTGITATSGFDALWTQGYVNYPVKTRHQLDDVSTIVPTIAVSNAYICFMIKDNPTLEHYLEILNNYPVYFYVPVASAVNPAIKIEGELGRFLNSSGEWTTGSTSLGAFKYEVTGGHTYDVVNAKAASSSYIMFLDANGNRIGNVVAMSSTNYPKVGDTRPMTMPSNCKYVWLVMSSANVDLPIPLIS